MGEISGAARNKGILFILFWLFSFPHLPFASAYSESFFDLHAFINLPSSFLLFQCLSPCCYVFSNIFLFLTFLCALVAGGHVSISPLFTSISHPFFSSSPLQFISLVSIHQGGRASCCPTVHVCSPTP